MSLSLVLQASAGTEAVVTEGTRVLGVGVGLFVIAIALLVGVAICVGCHIAGKTAYVHHGTISPNTAAPSHSLLQASPTNSVGFCSAFFLVLAIVLFFVLAPKAPRVQVTNTADLVQHTCTLMHCNDSHRVDVPSDPQPTPFCVFMGDTKTAI